MLSDKCPTCEGKGFVLVSKGWLFKITSIVECDKCGGSGGNYIFGQTMDRVLGLCHD